MGKKIVLFDVDGTLTVPRKVFCQNNPPCQLLGAHCTETYSGQLNLVAM